MGNVLNKEGCETKERGKKRGETKLPIVRRNRYGCEGRNASTQKDQMVLLTESMFSERVIGVPACTALTLGTFSDTESGRGTRM